MSEDKYTPDTRRTFFGGAAILAAGIVVVKLIGALFKIPLGNILGEEGFNHFTNAYAVFNVLLMISTAGLPVALSKTISEANAQGRRNQVEKIFRLSMITFIILGAVSFAVLFFFAEPLMKFQGDPGAALAAKAMAPTCFFICVVSAYRGYAQGHANMTPTSVSQIIEALAKLLVGVFLAWNFMRLGMGIETAAAGAIFGVTVGSGIALVYLAWTHKRNQRRPRGAPDRDRDRPDTSKQILKRLLIIAVPITIAASIVPLTTWLDTTQVQNILRDTMDVMPAEYYRDQELPDPVLKICGSYQMAITIYNLPSSFMVALTAAIIPAISACWVNKDKQGVGRIAASSLRMGSLLAFPAGIGLTVAATPIIGMLYPDANRAVADPCLMILGVASIFVCLLLLCNAILQASGFVSLPIIVMAIGCVAKLVVNNFLVKNEEIGILGAPVGTLVCYALTSVLALLMIERVIPSVGSYTKVFAKPLAASLIMGGAAWAACGFLTKIVSGMPVFLRAVEGTTELVLGRMGYAAIGLGTIGVAVVIYAVLIVLLGAVTKEDLTLMPKGDKIAKILRIRD